MYAILGKTGRYIGAFSANQAEHEVVFRPATVLTHLGHITEDDFTIHLVLELESDDFGKPVAQETGDRVNAASRRALEFLGSEPLIPIASPGKFVGEIV